MTTILILAVLATGRVAPDQVTFQYSFKKGQVIRSHMVMNMNMSMGAMNMTMDSSMHVDEANADGSASLTTQIDSGNMKMGSMNMAIPGKGKQFHMTVSKYGKRVVMDSDKNKDAPAVTVQEFPDRAIAVGESWDGQVQVQGGKQPVQVNAHFTLDSLRDNIAHVLVVEDGEVAKGVKIHGSGWMDWDTVKSIAVSAHIEGTEQMGGGMTPTFTSDVTTTVE